MSVINLDKFLSAITFLGIVIFMMLLKHTCVGSPSVMVLIFVDVGDVEVSLIRRHML
jgi:hypothetical protein